MKILDLKANNFKMFKSVDVKLDGKSTVIFGVNGTGKSTFLDMINYLFRIWINRINPLQGKAYKSFSPEQIHIGKSFFSFLSNVDMDKMIFELERFYKKINL